MYNTYKYIRTYTYLHSISYIKRLYRNYLTTISLPHNYVNDNLQLCHKEIPTPTHCYIVC